MVVEYFLVPLLYGNDRLTPTRGPISERNIFFFSSVAYTHPVIPPTGQLAIGAIGAMKVRPEYSAGDKQLAKAFAIDPTSAPPRELKVEPRLVVEVSFTADHRAVEGVELARLVQCFKHYCQAPGLLFADLI